MARLTATLTVLLFLFALSNARTPLDRPENDVVDRELPNFSPEYDAKPTLLLPSQKPESDPTNVVEPHPQTETKQLDIHTDAKDVEITKDLPAADTQTVDAVPLLKRPINRHYPLKRPDHFRHPRRSCHHGINPVMNPQIHRREISYGDDMILAGESKDFNTETFRGGDPRDIPEHRVWFQFHRRHHDDDHHHRHHDDDHHHHGHHDDDDDHHHRHHDDDQHEGMPRFPFRHHDMSSEQRFRKPFRGEEEESAEQQVRRPFRHEPEENREEDDGFMRGFRQFLDHLF